jgi:hypothetical protein
MTELQPAPVNRLQAARQELPYAVQRFTQFAVDNPGQVALLLAGTVVLSAAATNIVKPKNVLEALALYVVLMGATPFITRQAVEHGWLGALKVRDADGNLVTLRPGMEQ